LVNQQQDTLREIIEDFEEKVINKKSIERKKNFFFLCFLKEKSRLEEALLSENGQQQLAIRTYKIQLNKQATRINLLQNQIEQIKIKKEEKRNIALEIKQQHEQLNEELEQINIQTANIDPE